jgi:hypothetical protein
MGEDEALRRGQRTDARLPHYPQRGGAPRVAPLVRLRDLRLDHGAGR